MREKKESQLVSQSNHQTPKRRDHHHFLLMIITRRFRLVSPLYLPADEDGVVVY